VGQGVGQEVGAADDASPFFELLKYSELFDGAQKPPLTTECVR
jgi:hypothetical protein